MWRVARRAPRDVCVWLYTALHSARHQIVSRLACRFGQRAPLELGTVYALSARYQILPDIVRYYYVPDTTRCYQMTRDMDTERWRALMCATPRGALGGTSLWTRVMDGARTLPSQLGDVVDEPTAPYRTRRFWA